MMRATLKALYITTVVLALSWTGLVIASGGSAGAITSLASIGSSTSAQLAALLSDETGTDKAVFSQGPTFGGTVGMTGNLNVTGNEGITGTLGVTGAAVFQSTLNINGATAITGALGITGAFTCKGAANLTGPVAVSGASGSTGLTITQNTAGVALSVVGVSGSTGVVVATAGNSVALQVTGTGTGQGASITSGAAATTALTATSAIGNAAQFACDATSPLHGCITMTVQDSAPSGTSIIGELTMFTGAILRVAIDTAASFIGVANTGITATAAAAGANQAAATQLLATKDFYVITGCDSAKGVALPTGNAVNFAIRIMAQTVGQNCLVYGNSAENDTINGGAADAAYTQLGGTSLIYKTADGTNWFTY